LVSVVSTHFTTWRHGDLIYQEGRGVKKKKKLWKMSVQGLGWGNLREREHLEDPGVDGRIGCIFRKWCVWIWTGSSWLRIGTGGGHL
jgi:hypothetical protein